MAMAHERQSRLGGGAASGQGSGMSMEHRSLRIGSRGSALALAQAQLVAAALGRAQAMAAAGIEVVPVRTEGDRVQDRALAEIGGKALWTKEIDHALLDGRIDLAVHSMKDVETELPEAIALVAVLPRADPRDCLVGAGSIAALPQGAVIGTSSPRRRAQILNRRPDVQVVLLRGNVETRLARVQAGAIDATFLAAAGLQRLGIAAGVPLAIADWLPATAQGIIGITCRADDVRVRTMLAAIADAPTFRCMLAERAVLRGLGGDCHTSVAVHASGDARLELRAHLLSADGRERVSAQAAGAEPEALGAQVAAQLLAQASAGLRAGLRGQAG